MHHRSVSISQAALVITALLTLSLLGSAGPVVAADGLTGEALASKVAEIGNAAVQERGAVGLSIAVAQGGEMLVEKGFGKIELEHDVAANGDSVFRIGSITKQFTAAAVMKLIEEGATKNGKKLTLDAPITDFVDFPTQGKTVTVRHLLTHTSGIKSYTGLGEEWSKTVPLEITHDELLGLVKEREFDFEPNEKYLYNNTGYYLLGVLIEEVSGKDYAVYLAENFFEPNGLTHIRYGSNSALIRNRAQGYTMDGNEMVNDSLIGMSQPGAAGALISNAGDLVRWSRLLSAGKMISADSFRQMTTAHVLSNGESTSYGFGLSVDSMEGHDRISHGGGINGFNSMLAYFPDEDLTIAVISNSEAYRAATVAKRIAQAALGIEDKVVDAEIPAAELKRVEGLYPLTATPIELTIVARDGQVFVLATGQGENRLLSQDSPPGGPTEYRADFDNSVRIVFDAGSPAPSLTLFQGGAEIKAPRKE